MMRPAVGSLSLPGNAARNHPIIGLGAETAEQLVHEILSRDLRDRKAVARYAAMGARATY